MRRDGGVDAGGNYVGVVVVSDGDDMQLITTGSIYNDFLPMIWIKIVCQD